MTRMESVDEYGDNHGRRGVGSRLVYRTRRLVRQRSQVLCLLMYMMTCGLICQADNAWPIFRGDSRLSGVADGPIGSKLTLKWTYETGDEIESSPVTADGIVVIGSSDGCVHALSLQDGTRRWKTDLENGVEAPPLLCGDTVLVGNLSGVFFCLDRDDGSERWRYATEGKITGSALVVTNHEGKAMAVFGSYDSTLHAVSLVSGQREWIYESDGFINGAPATDGHSIVFGGCDGQVHFVGIVDGAALGNVDVESYVAASPAFVDGFVYIGQFAGQFFGIDAVRRERVWTYNATRDGAPFFSSAAVGEEVVVFGGRDNRVHCVDRRSGEKRWTFTTRDEADASPVIAGDRVVTASNDGRVTILSLREGKQLAVYEIGAAVTGSPAVSGRHIIVGAEDGRVYAFDTGED